MLTVKLSELSREVFNRGAIFGVTDLHELLDCLNPKQSADELLATIFEYSVREYEKHRPLILIQKVYCDPTPEYTQAMVDNFQGFLDGTVCEDQIRLIPSGIVAVSRMPDVNYGAFRNFDYDEPPTIRRMTFRGIYYFKTICTRPIVTDLDKEKHFTDKAQIYYFSKFNGYEYKVFVDQCLMDVFKFISNLKRNMELTELPVQIFDAIPEMVSQLEASTSDYYGNAAAKGYLVQ